MSVDDLLEKLDRTLNTLQLPPASNCGHCNVVLTGWEASLDFCTPSCQYAWSFGKTAGFARDYGRMAGVLGGCSYEPGCRCPARNNHVLPGQSGITDRREAARAKFEAALQRVRAMHHAGLMRSWPDYSSVRLTEAQVVRGEW